MGRGAGSAPSGECGQADRGDYPVVWRTVFEHRTVCRPGHLNLLLPASRAGDLTSDRIGKTLRFPEASADVLQQLGPLVSAAFSIAIGNQEPVVHQEFQVLVATGMD